MPDCSYCGRFINTGITGWMCGCEGERKAGRELNESVHAKRRLYPESNLPMSQFERFRGMGQDVLTVTDTSRYHGFYGFRRVVAALPI